MKLDLDTADSQRVVRVSLKTAWASSSDHDRRIIDQLLEQLKRERG